jgi:hypothetical protein
LEARNNYVFGTKPSFYFIFLVLLPLAYETWAWLLEMEPALIHL